MAEASFLTATRVAYDLVADSYAELLRVELGRRPVDRALLAAFAELVQGGAGGAVLDVGCGPGRVTAHLQSLGLSASGLDLSPGMIAAARREHPGLRFDEGSMLALDHGSGALGGVVAWYSIIHIPPELHPAVFAEFHRVLAPGGWLLLAFQVGDERRHISQGYGHEVALDAYRLPPDRIAGLLGQAGFSLHAQLLREPNADEKVQQAFLLAHKPA
ncbi:MAG TPA: class I SAM-dependent methyltransferase [Mycobacteriales bacterium]|nr:class I SAM-dependent methyltransferase [Mycobacteriales bacterium]